MLTVEECTLPRWIKLPRAWVKPWASFCRPNIVFSHCSYKARSFNLTSTFLEIGLVKVYVLCTKGSSYPGWLHNAFSESLCSDYQVSISESESDRWLEYFPLCDAVVLFLGNMLRFREVKGLLPGVLSVAGAFLIQVSWSGQCGVMCWNIFDWPSSAWCGIIPWNFWQSAALLLIIHETGEPCFQLK